MRERLNRSDLRFILVCLAISLLCGFEAWRDFGRAFPEAAIDFRLDRRQSRELAESFLQRHGHDVARHKHAVIFDYDNQAKIFLERELGAEAAGALYQDPVGLWRWSHRWFRPQQKEELRVELTVDGRLARFEHVLPESAHGAALDADVARARAESLLVAIRSAPLTDYEFIDASRLQRPHRVDQRFTWKLRNLETGEATFRVRVELAGARFSAYESFLEVPDGWRHAYRQLRARNQATGMVAAVLLALTAMAMLVSLVLRIRDRDVHWRTAAGFGSIAFGLQLLASLNGFDLEKFSYPTEDGYGSFVAWYLLSSILVALASAGGIFLLTAAAEPIYRQRFPSHLSLTSVLSWRGIRTRSFFKQVLLGFTLAFFFPAFQAVFYLVAAHLGAWAPLDVPYSNLLNTAFPWAVVLLAGFSPAVTEEFMSRMFSIPFLRGVFGKRLGSFTGWLLAIVVSAFVWGFAHAGYPNQPFYIRGLEVGVVGIVVGLVMMRWGIVAPLVWHYSIDAFYTAFLLVRSSNPYFVYSGWVAAGILLIPLLVSLVCYAVRGGFEPESGLHNADEQPPPPAPSAALREERPALPPYELLPRRSLVWAAVLAIPLLGLYGRSVTRPGAGNTLQTSRTEALRAAEDHLRLLGNDPARYQVAIALDEQFDPVAGAYVLEQAGLRRLNDLFSEPLRAFVWRVRFFRPEEQEQFTLLLPPRATAGRGKPAVPLWGFRHALPDSAAGDSLNLDDARRNAQEFLRRGSVDPDRLVLKESESQKLSRRVDHRFVWELADSTLAEGSVRYEMLVSGGSVSRLRPSFHVPEEWRRQYEERPFWRQLVWLAFRGLLGTTILGILFLFLALVRSRRYAWRIGIKWGAVVGSVGVLLLLLRWNALLCMQYSTTTPMELHVVTMGMSALVQFVFLGLLTAALIGVVSAIRPRVRLLLARALPRDYARDALLSSLVAILLLAGVDRLCDVLVDVGSTSATIHHLPVIPEAASHLPWLDALLAICREAILALALLAILVEIGRYGLGDRRLAVFVAIAALLLAADGPRTWGQFGLSAALLAIQVTAGVGVIRFLLRGNELAYVMTFMLVRGGSRSLDWLRQPSTDQQASGWILGVLVVMLVLGAGWAATRRGAGPTPAGGSSNLP